MAAVSERYVPHLMAANATFTVPQGKDAIGGFLCTVGGVLNAYVDDGTTKFINALAVTAGIYYPIPAYVGPSGQAKVVLSGGAAGTIFV